VADRAGPDTESVARMTGHRSGRHFARVTHGSMIHLTGAIRTRSPTPRSAAGGDELADQQPRQRPVAQQLAI